MSNLERGATSLGKGANLADFVGSEQSPKKKSNPEIKMATYSRGSGVSQARIDTRPCRPMLECVVVGSEQTRKKIGRKKVQRRFLNAYR